MIKYLRIFFLIMFIFSVGATTAYGFIIDEIDWIWIFLISNEFIFGCIIAFLFSVNQEGKICQKK